MCETKAFPTADVLSTITGRLMGEIGGVYRVLEFMTGHPVWTHQLPRIGREACPVVVAMHPTLAQACEEADQVNRENYREWLATWLDRYGPEIAVPRLSEEQHENIDPLSELFEKIDPSRIVVIGGEPSDDR